MQYIYFRVVSNKVITVEVIDKEKYDLISDFALIRILGVIYIIKKVTPFIEEFYVDLNNLNPPTNLNLFINNFSTYLNEAKLILKYKERENKLKDIL